MVGFVEVGVVQGSVSTIDLDVRLPSASPCLMTFDAIRLRDDPDEGSHGFGSPGADIDAVEILFGIEG